MIFGTRVTKGNSRGVSNVFGKICLTFAYSVRNPSRRHLVPFEKYARTLVSPMFARVPQEGGRVQRWESVCWGVLGTPKVCRFLGFLGYWFSVSCFLVLGVSVSKFLGFLVSSFQSFLVSLSLGILVSWFIGFLVPWFIGFLVSWFLDLLVYWFLGFKISWFRSFLVSKFLGLKVSWFLGFLFPKVYLICCGKNSYPTLPKFRFMFSGRYWPHFQGF